MSMHGTKRLLATIGAGAAILAMTLSPAAAQGEKPQGGTAPGGTPAEMVTTYNSLADAILAVKKTEAGLVRSILSAGYAHAQVELGRARAAIKANDAKASQSALENLAADVAQVASEGDAAVAAVRKRLLEGGHHHHADGEAQGIYDQGFVVVTRAAKATLLDASRVIGQLARAPKADALEAEWKKVQTTFAELMK
jgi:hypothetical protein